MKLFTIGFTKKSAERFFEELRRSGAKRIVDVRLNNSSQLAGFTKRQDLAYFLARICGMDYIHLPLLAPTEQLFDAYRKQGGSWETYEKEFVTLLRERRVEEKVPRDLIADSCLLCSEESPDHCHRRLVAEYLRHNLGDVEIVHLG
jgi:uncharacterized protein (DUF488 family)